MSVLFVCAGNAARSQMAEAFYNSLTDSQDAQSAGTETIIGKPMPEAVIAVMDEVSIDVSAAERKAVTEDMVEGAGRVVLMTYSSLPAYLRHGDNFEHWDVADPRGLGLEAHRLARDAIKVRIEKMLGEQVDRAES